MKFNEQVFINPNGLISKAAEIIFVADLFEEDYAGGAEMTSEVLINTSPFVVQKIHSKNVNLGMLNQGKDKYWIFGNFSQMNPELIPSIIANLKYSILEYDYKYCKFRSAEKHKTFTSQPCDCHDQLNGKLISAFYYGAQTLWWMSESQKNHYLSLFPFLSEKDNIVLSSVFSRKTLSTLKMLRESLKNEDRKGWIVLGSQSWIKGFDTAKEWCENNHKTFEVVWNLPYEQVLAKLASSEGFVYLPLGGDTCPRMVIEAKLLGCKLHINDNVQHKDEEWFNSDDISSIEEYLSTAPDLFWKVITKIMNKKATISGYITTYNCVSQNYPFEQSIESMLQFCEEVCVVDGGSTDETSLRLLSLQIKHSKYETADKQKFIDSVTTNNTNNTIDFDAASKNLNDISKVKVKYVLRDWSHPRFAIFDGMQKAEARAMCTGEFCWQMDSDEVVHEDDAPKIIDLCSKMPKDIDIVSLPVVEYWGSKDKIRIDIQPWKWRLSKNLQHITHGIPIHLKREDALGIYALPGTDGCDMIHATTGESLNHVTFHNEVSERIRRAALTGNAEALKTYESWFNQVINHLPGVFHYSWYDISRKMRLYRDYWTRHWNSLYNMSLEDTAESNMMFDVPWSQVTEEMIEKRAKELAEGTGGWIWHQKWNGYSIPHILVNKNQPKLMSN